MVADNETCCGHDEFAESRDTAGAVERPVDPDVQAAVAEVAVASAALAVPATPKAVEPSKNAPKVKRKIIFLFIFNAI